MTFQPYPRSLYRRKEGVAEHYVFDGVPCEMLTVHSESQEAEAKKQGWCNSPEEAGAAVKEVRSPEHLQPKAASKPDPFDHDGDGKPGGSLPKKKAVTRRKAKRRDNRK